MRNRGVSLSISPLVKENEYIGQESASFLKRYYNGDITAMLSSYMENNRLSDKELDTLRSILSKGKGETVMRMQYHLWFLLFFLLLVPFLPVRSFSLPAHIFSFFKTSFFGGSSDHRSLADAPFSSSHLPSTSPDFRLSKRRPPLYPPP